MKRNWTCQVTIDVQGEDLIPCGFKCSSDHSGADHDRINHLTIHNPSPAQWAEAYSTMQEWREQAKKATA